MSALNIRVGASVDRSLHVAFKPLIEAAKRAKAAIEAEAKASGRAISKGVKSGTNAAEAEFARLAREVQSDSKAFYQAGDAAKKFGKDAKASFDDTRKSFAQLAREADKMLNKLEKQKHFSIGGALRELGRRGVSSVGASARDMVTGGDWKAATKSGFSTAGSLGVAGAKKAMHAALAITGNLARGAGVELDAGAIFKKNTDLETNAANIANSGFIAGDSRNNSRVDKKDLIREALNVGEKTGSDANVALEGLGKFVSKTGDLRSGRDVLEQMAIYAKATGSSMEDMMDAAGDVSNALGDVENKGETVKTLMRAFAGQGKLGAVEIKDLSVQMAKIGAASNRFEGGSQSIVQMGVLAQQARATGGGMSASNSATAVGAFAELFSKNRNVKALKAAGVELEGKGGKVRNVKDLLVDMLRGAEKKGGGIGTNFDTAMGEMVSTSASRKATKGFEDIFKVAGGGDEGVKKVIARFEELENSIISDEEVMDSFKRAMKTSESQAEVFNNSIRKSAEQMQEALLPAMVSLAAAIVPVVQQLAGYVTAATGDRQLEDVQNAAETDSALATKRAEKQMKGGKISEATEEELRVASKEAFEARARAQAGVKQAEEMLARKKDGTDTAGSFWAMGTLENKSDDPNSMWGRTFGTSQKGDEQRLEERKAALKKADETYQQILGENKKVADALKGELIVRVKNIDDLKTALNAPGVKLGGVGATPEEKLGDQ